MLILTRNEGEKIVFPGLGITVEVTRINGGKVRLGIDAPPEIKVHREEVQRRIDSQIPPLSSQPSATSMALA